MAQPFSHASYAIERMWLHACDSGQRRTLSVTDTSANGVRITRIGTRECAHFTHTHGHKNTHTHTHTWDACADERNQLDRLLHTSHTLGRKLAAAVTHIRR